MHCALRDRTLSDPPEA